LCALAFRFPVAGNLLVHPCRLGFVSLRKQGYGGIGGVSFVACTLIFTGEELPRNWGTEEHLNEFLQSDSFCRTAITGEIEIDLREGLQAAEIAA